MRWKGVVIFSGYVKGIKVAKTGKGKVVNRGTQRYPRIFVYIPSKVATDSAFPFEIGEDVQVSIEEDKLIISKWRPEED